MSEDSQSPVVILLFFGLRILSLLIYVHLPIIACQYTRLLGLYFGDKPSQPWMASPFEIDQKMLTCRKICMKSLDKALAALVDAL